MCLFKIKNTYLRINKNFNQKYFMQHNWEVKMKMVYKGNPMLRKKHQRVDAIQHDNTRSSVDIFPMCTCGPVLFLVKCTVSCVVLSWCTLSLSLSLVHRLNTKVVLVHLYFLASATVSYKCCYVTFIFFIIQPHSTALHHSQMPKLLSYCEFFCVCVCHRFLLVLLLVI